MRADRLPVWLIVSTVLATLLILSAPRAGAESAPPPPAPQAEAPPLPPVLAYPDLSSTFTWSSSLKTVKQIFGGTLKRHGRQIYLEEESTSSGPISYNEYHVYDFDKNMLYRVLQDEKIYFETPLTLEQRVDGIRKGWVPAAGVFAFNNVSITLSSRDIPLRPDTIDGQPVQLLLREISAEIPAIGAVKARTARSYTLVWQDPTYALPVKITYSVNFVNYIVEYRDIGKESLGADLFLIPKGFVNLTPY